MPPLDAGRIVWVEVADKRGVNFYSRPLIILTKAEEIATAEKIIGVVASCTSAQVTPRPEFIPIPYNPHGPVCTKLQKPTVAVCNWLHEFTVDEIVNDRGGRVPATVLEVIIKKVEELLD